MKKFEKKIHQYQVAPDARKILHRPQIALQQEYQFWEPLMVIDYYVKLQRAILSALCGNRRRQLSWRRIRG